MPVCGHADKPHWGARKIRELCWSGASTARGPAKSAIHAVPDRHGLVGRGCV
jgi:hypothetical protein